MTTKIWSNLDFRNEQLPRKTGLGGPAILPQRPLNLVDPDAFVQNNPGVQANLKEFSPINSKEIRVDLLNRLTRQVEEVNRQIASSNRFSGIRFEVHEQSGQSFAVIRDSESGEVLKQIPAQAFLEIAGRLKDASGLLVDTQI